MNIDEFVSRYMFVKDKEFFIKEHIVTQYVPYMKKVNDCEHIVKATTSKDGIFKQNTPMRYMLFNVNLIDKYTDLDANEIFESYEALDKENLIEILISAIPKRELDSYQKLLSMCTEDYMINNRDLVSYIETKVEELQLTGDAILNAFNNFIPSDIGELEEG